MSETYNNEYFGISSDKATNVSNYIILAIVYWNMSEYLEIKEISAGLHRIKDLIE